MVGGGRVVAMLAADGNVYPTNALPLKNYKIKIDGDIAKRKSVGSSNVSTTVVDLGKQLLQCARDNNLEGVQLSISKGAPYSHDWLGMTALHFAAMNNQYEICEMLLNGGINKDAKTKVDRTPLHLACFYGNEKIVQLLLSKNCQVNSLDMLKMTPLHWAVENGYKKVVRLLLKYNADVTIVSKFGKTPIALAVMTEQADVLEELQRMRKAQIHRKVNEEREKETSNAVNSIMNFGDEDNEEDNRELYNNVLNSNRVNMSDPCNTSTINLLESHGITILPATDDDSKELLNRALNNGRQLILSEGGKLLLNESKMFNNANKIATSNNNQISSKQANLNSKQSKINIQSHTVPPTIASNMNVLINSKTRPNNKSNNLVLKTNTTSNGSNFEKNKNIRIISLSHFKQIYGNTNIKPAQGSTNSINRTNETSGCSQIIKVQQVKDVQEARRKSSLGNENNEKVQSNETQIKKEENSCKRPSSSGVRFYPAKMSNMSNHQSKMAVLQLHSQMQNSGTPASSNNTSAFPSSLSSGSNFQRINNNDMNKNLSATKNSAGSSPSVFVTNTSLNKPNQNKAMSSNVIPLLSPNQICRQLLELRKQNEELRRKFDLAQKQKDDLRLRVERLEELLLLEKSDVFST